MSDLTPETLAELRSRAEACPMSDSDPDTLRLSEWYEVTDLTERHYPIQPIDAAFIAAASPDVVLGLLDRLAHMTEARDNARAEVEWLTATVEAAIDVAHLDRQQAWSAETFGPAEVRGHRGILDHIRKELVEIEADPGDVTEWADLIILAFNGAWRSGNAPADTIAAIKAKQERNETRTWPDWRTADPNKAIEHVRGRDGEADRD